MVVVDGLGAQRVEKERDDSSLGSCSVNSKLSVHSYQARLPSTPALHAAHPAPLPPPEVARAVIELMPDPPRPPKGRLSLRTKLACTPVVVAAVRHLRFAATAALHHARNEKDRSRSPSLSPTPCEMFGKRKKGTTTLFTAPVHAAWVDACYDEVNVRGYQITVKKGNRPQSCLNKTGVVNVLMYVKRHTGIDLDHKQHSNHWTMTKLDWTNWKALSNLSGVGIDPDTSAIIASQLGGKRKKSGIKTVGNFAMKG